VLQLAPENSSVLRKTKIETSATVRDAPRFSEGRVWHSRGAEAAPGTAGSPPGRSHLTASLAWLPVAVRVGKVVTTESCSALTGLLLWAGSGSGRALVRPRAGRGRDRAGTRTEECRGRAPLSFSQPLCPMLFAAGKLELIPTRVCDGSCSRSGTLIRI
jgi:hypothetical protein